MNDPDTIRRLLALDVWAVVGLSEDPSRTSHEVAAWLQRQGRTILPVNPVVAARGGSILGVPAFASLAEIRVPVDVVDVFRRSEHAGAVVDEAVKAGFGAVWLQLGVRDDAAAARARAAGVAVVMDTCPKIEWAQHGPPRPPGGRLSPG